MKPANAKEKVTVLVVDDSAFMRRSICKMLEGNRYLAVIGEAGDGLAAIDQVKALRPDVVTLDIKMPLLDGLAALERIMQECPTPVIMLSSLTGRGGEMTLKALELGAVDFIDKTAASGPMEISVLAEGLIAKLLVASRVDVRKLHQAEAKVLTRPAPQPVFAHGDTEVVMIGTSTGGPPALQEVLSKLPAQFPAPLLIVQHMPVGFTKSLADRLNSICAITVKEAEDGELLRPGCAYIAPAGQHLKMRRRGSQLSAVLDLAPSDSLHRPSVDALLGSAAEVCGRKTLAFILTGMGKDGLQGAKALKRVGGRVVVEAEETCIVFGMPRAVLEEVAVDGVVPLYAMAETMLKMAAQPVA